MKLSNKKILAREFLAFFIVIIISLITFFSFNLYNSWIDKKINNNSIEITTNTKKVNSLVSGFQDKLNNQYKLYNHYSIYTNHKYQTIDKLWKAVRLIVLDENFGIKNNNLSTNQLIKFYTDNNIKHANFKKFISKNSLTEEENSAYLLSKKHKSEIKNLNLLNNDLEKEKYTFQQKINFTLDTIIIISLIVFVFRYLYYGFRWSLKTLKEKEN